MSTYTGHDYERIAEIVEKSPALVRKYEKRFETAAIWYRSFCRAPKGAHHADTGKRMRQISNAARMLLKQLEIYDYRNSPDGPGDITLLEFLASAERGSEDEIIQATGQIGRLVEIFDAIDAAELLEECGRKAEEDAKLLSRVTSLKGRRGDYAANGWLEEMMSIYKVLTRKEPRISVVSSGSKRGQPTGPFLRFLVAASGPVEYEGKRPLCLRRVREQVRHLSKSKY